MDIQDSSFYYYKKNTVNIYVAYSLCTGPIASLECSHRK